MPVENSGVRETTVPVKTQVSEFLYGYLSFSVFSTVSASKLHCLPVVKQRKTQAPVEKLRDLSFFVGFRGEVKCRRTGKLSSGVRFPDGKLRLF